MTGYLSLSAAAAYVGRSPRWLRRRLSEIPHYRPDHSGILFRCSDLDGYLSRFRKEPLNLDAVVSSVLGQRKGRG